MKGCEILDKYAIRKVMVFSKIEYDTTDNENKKVTRADAFNVYEEIDVSHNVHTFLSDLPLMFKIEWNSFFDSARIMQSLCEMLTKQTRIEQNSILGYKYNFISDKGFEIIDTKGSKRTFIFDLKYDQTIYMYMMRILEIPIGFNQFKEKGMKPLKYVLGITENINDYTEPFMKGLKLNNIEIMRGNFY